MHQEGEEAAALPVPLPAATIAGGAMRRTSVVSRPISCDNQRLKEQRTEQKKLRKAAPLLPGAAQLSGGGQVAQQAASAPPAC